MSLGDLVKRTTYDAVEAKAMRIRENGHDIKLKLCYTGMLKVYYNGKKVLEDGPRDYSVALQKVMSLGFYEKPKLNEVSEQEVDEEMVRVPRKKKRTQGAPNPSDVRYRG